MIMYEHDPDVIRWGLQFLHGDQSVDSGYCEAQIHNKSHYYERDYSGESDYGEVHTSIENDEVLAHALQEGFSQLAVEEPSLPFYDTGEYSHESLTSQDWYSSPERTITSGVMDQSSSCSSPEENVDDGEGSEPYPVHDFCELDGEVEKRLNQMIPMPHIPRINGDIPSVDEATSDHERLLERLQLYELAELKIPGDGNCQFRAISDQFYRTPEHHKFVRLQVIKQLRAHPELYEGYVPMDYDDYLKKLSRTGEWGDHVTLQAAADTYGVKIFVITSFKDTCYIEILPTFQKSNRVIFLSFWAEVHYNSIYPEGELPAVETKKKRRWWPFGSRH